MTDHLPPANIKSKADVAEMLYLGPLRSITDGLRRGNGYDLAILRPLARQCRALADAYDDRMRMAGFDEEVIDDDR